MRVTLTGATGRIGTALVRALRERGDEVTVLSRDPARARDTLGGDLDAVAWDPGTSAAPPAALAGRDGVIHLAGEDVAQRWTAAARQRIRASRERGTRHLVDGLARADPRPPALICASAVGWYGPRGDERLTEDAPAGGDFLAGVVAAWEREARRAEKLGLRVVTVRTGVVLDAGGGALARMLPFFRLGLGGPVAGGRQYLSWIHVDDVAGIYLAALGGREWSGAVNATAPEPVTNREFSRALGRALRRPALAPVPGLAVRALYGRMAEIVTTGQRAVPAGPLAHGYAFRHPELGEALRSALG